MKHKKYIILILVFGAISCVGSKNSTRLDSSEISSKTERIEILEREIFASSAIENAEFQLFNVNGFSNDRGTVPGASSCDYKFVVKVNSTDIHQWTEGFIKAKFPKKNLDWTTALIQNRAQEWIINGSPEFYEREESDVTLIVYRASGILFKRVIAI